MIQVDSLSVISKALTKDGIAENKAELLAASKNSVVSAGFAHRLFPRKFLSDRYCITYPDDLHYDY